MHGKILGALIACLLLPVIASAEEATAPGPYTVSSVSFSIQGRTREAALRRNLEAAGPLQGASFATKAELEAAVEERRRSLADNRVLASVEAEIEYVERSGGGSEASVSFAVTDTNNVVVLPEPKYDSNAGLSLTLKGRDYNFLGSMRSLELDLGYTSESATSRYFSGQTNFVLPFRALGSEMSFGLFEDAAVWADGSAAASASAASIGYAIPGLGFPASVKAIGGYYHDAALDNEARGLPLLDTTDPDYLSAALIAKADAPLGLELGALGELRLEPRLEARDTWWPGRSLLYPKRGGLALEASAKIGAGRIGWVGNFQDGARAELEAVGTEYLAASDFVGEARASYEGHWAFGSALGLSARAIALGRPLGAFPGDELQGLGSYLRGVVDARIDARYGAFLNLSAPVKLFDFPTHAIIGKDILDFELQAAPFVDAAYIAGAADASADGAWAAAGLELTVFPKAFRSFIVRASIGYDLVRAGTAGSFGPYEIYIGTGLFLDTAKTSYEDWLDK